VKRLENQCKNNVGKVLVMFIAATFLLMGFAGGSQTPDEDVFQVNENLDKNLIDATGTINVRISIPRDVDIKKISSQLEDIGVIITRTNTASVNYFECTIDAEMINQISALDGITWMQQIFEPQTLMDNIQSNTFMGADTPQANAFTGSGILAEVIDNGCDMTHTDLGQVQYTDFSPVADSHGTCTTGIMFGDGTGNMAAQGIMYQGTGALIHLL